MNEINQNAIKMAKCKRMSQTLVSLYAAVALAFGTFSMFACFRAAYDVGLIIVVISFVLKITAFVLGILGSVYYYFKKNFFACIIQSVDSLMCLIIAITLDIPVLRGMSLFSLIFIAAATYLALKNNREYDYLKTQPGFPYFNETFEKHRNEAEEFKSHDKYRERMEQFEADGIDDMSELDFDAGEQKAPGFSENPELPEMEELDFEIPEQ